MILGILSSNKMEAQLSSAAIANSLVGVQGNTGVSIDNSSTLKGNEAAKAWLSKIESLSGEVSDAVRQMGTNINSVANEFEIMDINLARDINAFRVSMERLIDFND